MSVVATTISILALLTATWVLLAVLRYYQVRYQADAEVVRKLFHIGGGALGLALPWVFDRLAPVLVLTLLAAISFVALRTVPRLREGLGQVLLGVKRHSVGEFGFLASFCLLFWLSHGDKLLYSIPIMMVALADAMAALIGQSYGKFQLHMSGDRKSIEGVVTFFLVAFFCVHVPVLLWGDTGRAESLLIAVNVSAMVMLAEAAAWWGLDNLIIPMWGYMVLKSLLLAEETELAGDLTFLASLATFMYFWRARTTLGDDAIAGAVLYGYVVWSVGGFGWTLAPLLMFASYATVTARVPLDNVRDLRFPVVLANVAGSIPWLLAFRESGDVGLHVPFAACFGANVATIALARARYADPALPLRRALRLSVGVGTLVALPSMLAIYGLGVMSGIGVVALVAAIVMAATLFERLQPDLSQMPLDYGRRLRQAAIVTVCSVLAYAIEESMSWSIEALRRQS